MTAPHPACGLAPGRSLAGLRILLTEDEPLVEATFAELLRGMECEVAVAEDGWARLGIVAEWHFGLLLTDLGMRNLDGFGLIRALRLVRPRLPVAVATGQTALLPLPLCVVAEGPTRPLRKPVACGALSAAVAQVSCHAAARRVPRCAFAQAVRSGRGAFSPLRSPKGSLPRGAVGCRAAAAC